MGRAYSHDLRERALALVEAGHSRRTVAHILKLGVSTVINWASKAESLAQRHTRYQAVCDFARYVRQEDPLHESPSPNYFGYKKSRRVPYREEADWQIFPDNEQTRCCQGRHAPDA